MFGPETHMTSICGMALGTRPIPQENNVEFATANFLLPSGDKSDKEKNAEKTGSGSSQAACIRKERVCFIFKRIKFGGLLVSFVFRVSCNSKIMF